MKVVFRVDASVEMGVGHVMRCLTLANELRLYGGSILFVCRHLDGNLISTIKKEGYNVLILPKMMMAFGLGSIYSQWLTVTEKEDSQQVVSVLPDRVDLLIVDSYGLGAYWLKSLRPHVRKIMVIDDLVDKYLDCDFLLNQNLGINKEMYRNKVPESCRVITGSRYSLLRSEFFRLRGNALDRRDQTTIIKKVLVSVGGADPQNITHKILREIEGKYDVVVVMGESSPHKIMIKKYAYNRGFKVLVSVTNMAALMMDADLAIGAAGSSAWERCCLALPTLLYITEDNQKKGGMALECAGAVKVVHDLREDLSTISSDIGLWKDMSLNAKKVCDGLGARRVVVEIRMLKSLSCFE